MLKVKRMPQGALLFASLSGIAQIGCSTCDTSGCDAAKLHAEDRGTGVAGVLAVYNDVQEDGCNACPFGRAELNVWHVDGRIESDEDAQAVASAREADVTVDADGSFFLDLDPGHYLFCATSYVCVSIEVTKDETLTVNYRSPAFNGRGYFVGAPEDDLDEVETLRIAE